MKFYDTSLKYMDAINAVGGTIVAVLSAVFGTHWLLFVGFIASAIFIEIGQTINVDLTITTYVGWFTLASLIINELRGILENFVEAGDNVPSVLTKGLEVAENAINKGE